MKVETAWRSKECDEQFMEESVEFVKSYNKFSKNEQVPEFVILRSSIPHKRHSFQIRIASLVFGSSKQLKKHLKSYFLQREQSLLE
jgi:hypothetical protein